jgi:hypothetical protein
MQASEIRTVCRIVGEKHVTDEKFYSFRLYAGFCDLSALVAARGRTPAYDAGSFANHEILQREQNSRFPARGAAPPRKAAACGGGRIVLETLRMNAILEMDKTNNTVTVEAGVTFASLMDKLEKNGQKIGVAPSGAIPGTVGAQYVAARRGLGQYQIQQPGGPGARRNGGTSQRRH